MIICMIIVGGIFGLVSWRLTDPNRKPLTPKKGHWIGRNWIEED